MVGFHGFLKATAWAILAVSLNASLLGVLATQDQDNIDKLAAPKPASYKSAVNRIKTVFANELKDRSRPGQLRAAEKLIKVAGEEKDKILKFVLLDQARLLGVQHGSIKIAWQASELLSKEFKVDYSESIQADLRQSLKNIKDVNVLVDSIPAILETVDSINETKEFDLSNSLLDRISRAARLAKISIVVEQLETKRKKTLELKKLYASYIKAIAKLKTDSSHSKSRLVVGNYLCFVKDDFDAGLPYLAGFPSETAEIACHAARSQMQTKKTPQGIGETGRLWLAASKGSKDLIAIKQREHAATLLTLAIKDATGVLKKDIEQHLATVKAAIAEDQGQAISADSLRFICSKTWKVAWTPKDGMRNIKFELNGGMTWIDAAGNTNKRSWKIKDSGLHLEFTAKKSFLFHLFQGQFVATQIDKTTKAPILTRICEMNR